MPEDAEWFGNDYSQSQGTAWDGLLRALALGSEQVATSPTLDAPRGNPEYPPSASETYRRDAVPVAAASFPPYTPRVPGDTPDAREAGDLAVPRSVGAQYQQDAAAGFPVEPQRSPPPDQTGGAVSVEPGALASLGIGGFATRIGEMEQHAKNQQTASEAKGDLLGRTVERRNALLEKMTSELSEYREGLAAARPKEPALRELPNVPDVKIRPWLDPEGKDAITVMVQTLGMLATGISGMVTGATLTATRQFREAAEAWRRDEIDVANGRMNQFKVTVEKIRGDNETALKQFELADKRYGANLEAKRAAVIARLDELGLHDKAVEAAMLPYDQAILTAQQGVENTSKILTHQEKLFAVQARYQKAGADIPASMWKAIGEYAGLQEQLKTATEPEQRASIQTRMAILKASVEKFQKQMISRQEAGAGIGIARVEIPKIDQKLQGLQSLGTNVSNIAKAVEVLNTAGLLPPSPAPFDKWVTEKKRMFPHLWTPEVQSAYSTIEQFLPGVLITYDRDVLNEVGGPRIAIAFNIPKEPSMLSYHQFRGIARAMAKGAREARTSYEGRKKALSSLTSTTPPSIGEEEDSGGGSDTAE